MLKHLIDLDFKISYLYLVISPIQIYLVNLDMKCVFGNAVGTYVCVEATSSSFCPIALQGILPCVQTLRQIHEYSMAGEHFQDFLSVGKVANTAPKFTHSK